jgi:predicted transglutaminase-like cysteine proteinase
MRMDLHEPFVRVMRDAVAGSRPNVPNRLAVLPKESALALLARSIAFGHGQVAVIRLAMAVHAGADVPHGHWTYCREAASRCKDATLQALFLEATRIASERATR